MFMQFSARSGDQGMRAFVVMLPSGVRYWTVLDEELAVVPVADSFLRQVRFGRDGAESTTKAYAGGIALFLRWCARSGRTWQAGIGQLGLFMTWLAHAGPGVWRAGGDRASRAVHDLAGARGSGGFGSGRAGRGGCGAGRARECPGALGPADQRSADGGARHGRARGRRRDGAGVSGADAV